MSASAVGLGNLWRFSYLTGEHGGAPFVLTYVLCLFLIAVPVMVAELVVGSHGRGSPMAAIPSFRPIRPGVGAPTIGRGPRLSVEMPEMIGSNMPSHI